MKRKLSLCENLTLLQLRLPLLSVCSLYLVLIWMCSVESCRIWVLMLKNVGAVYSKRGAELQDARAQPTERERERT